MVIAKIVCVLRDSGLLGLESSTVRKNAPSVKVHSEENMDNRVSSVQEAILLEPIDNQPVSSAADHAEAASTITDIVALHIDYNNRPESEDEARFEIFVL